MIDAVRAGLPGGVVTAGNASQFSDGASACVRSLLIPKNTKETKA